MLDSWVCRKTVGVSASRKHCHTAWYFTGQNSTKQKIENYCWLIFTANLSKNWVQMLSLVIGNDIYCHHLFPSRDTSFSRNCNWKCNSLWIRCDFVFCADVIGISDVEIDPGYNQDTLHPLTEYTVRVQAKIYNLQDVSWPARRANFKPRLLLHTSSNPYQGTQRF